MKLPTFRYFLSVAEHGSIRRAADQLHISASALTRQIQQLEHDFDCKLFERQKSGMQLTEEGHILQHHMQNTMYELDFARDEIRKLKDIVSGHVTYSSIEGTLSSWLLPATSSFHSLFPGVTFDAIIDSSDSTYHAVAANQVDFGIAILDKSYSGIEVLRTLETCFKIVVRPSHPIANNHQLPVEAIANYPLVLLNRSFYTRQLFDSLAAKAGIELDVMLSLNNIELIKSKVQGSDCVTVLPDYACQDEFKLGRLKGINLQQFGNTIRPTILFKKKGRRLTSATEKFLEVLENWEF